MYLSWQETNMLKKIEVKLTKKAQLNKNMLNIYIFIIIVSKLVLSVYFIGLINKYYKCAIFINIFFIASKFVKKYKIIINKLAKT